jgi:glycosyltransferase involved in cell wall biosynthesis
VSNRPGITIVVPVYNEEASVQPLYRKICEACEELRVLYEVIFVDDGSTDQTFHILERIHRQDARLKVVRFRKNFGQTAAMAAGFEYAKGEIIVSMDGDLQNDPADIPRLLAKLEEGYDVVCGWRKRRRDKFWTRRLPSAAANWIIGRVTGVPIHDNGCSLKAYRASVIKSVSLYGEMHRFIPAMSTLAGARIAEIPVDHHPRRFGKSKYGLGRIWRVVLDIITVKLITGSASRPALWFGLPGFAGFGLGVIALLVAVPLYSEELPFAWLVLSTLGILFFLLSLHLLSMGMIGELCMKTGDYLPKKVLRPTIRTL